MVYEDILHYWLRRQGGGSVNRSYVEFSGGQMILMAGNATPTIQSTGSLDAGLAAYDGKPTGNATLLSLISILEYYYPAYLSNLLSVS